MGVEPEGDGGGGGQAEEEQVVLAGAAGVVAQAVDGGGGDADPQERLHRPFLAQRREQHLAEGDVADGGVKPGHVEGEQQRHGHGGGDAQHPHHPVAAVGFHGGEGGRPRAPGEGGRLLEDEQPDHEEPEHHVEEDDLQRAAAPDGPVEAL